MERSGSTCSPIPKSPTQSSPILDAPGPVTHYRATRPLIHEVDQLEPVCRRRFCRPGVERQRNDPETAAAYYAALRRLRVGSLSVAHVTKASTSRDARPEDATVYGSAFWCSLARSAWHLGRADNDENRMTLGLFHAKHNYGKLPPIGLELTFSEGHTSIEPIDAASVTEFAGSLTIQQRLRHLLKRGPQTIEAITVELGDDKPAQHPPHDQSLQQRRQGRHVHQTP